MGSPPEAALLALAAVFAVVTGANDGGALLSPGLRLTSLRVIVAVGLLAVFVGVGPAVFGTQVATTFAVRLVGFSGPQGRSALFVGIVVAVLLVAYLTLKGRPTSLTLAVIGAIAGSGLGHHMPVAWGTLGLVLGVGLLAPFVGALLASSIFRLIRAAPAAAGVSRVLGRWHRFAFGLQCFAYSVNDGQKMLAVFAIATGVNAAPVRAAWWELAIISALFTVGVLLGLPRMAGELTTRVFAVRPTHAVSAELAASGAVLGTAALGVPVSMTQALTGGLVGVGASRGYGRVRWAVAGRVVLAWVVTLPAGFVLAAGGALALGVVR